MRISTEIRSIAAITGEEKAVEYVAKAGFDAWDFSMSPMCKFVWATQSVEPSDHPLAGNDYLKFARKLKKIGLDNGIKCNQSHAPQPTYIKEVRSYLKRAIECTAEAGGEICVIHPDNFKSAEENAEMYRELLPFAKECNVKIATENMFGRNKVTNRLDAHACGLPLDFKKHLDLISDDYFVACVDIGHSEIESIGTSCVEMLRTLGDKVKALHIHDNDKANDLHQIPFSGSIDFNEVLKTLKEINYRGDFTLEAYKYLSNHTEETVFDGVKSLAKSAKKLVDMYNLL